MADNQDTGRGDRADRGRASDREGVEPKVEREPEAGMKDETATGRNSVAEEIEGKPEPATSPFRSWPYVDRRAAADRRAAPTSVWSSLLGRGQRQQGRRQGEDRNIYVDVYGRREIILVVLILVLNILDAYFTLDYIEKGGAEANPIAQKLLDLGDTWFVYAKSFLVGLCLIFLLVHKKFSYVDLALGFLCTFYTLLLGYHIILQVRYYLAH